MVDVFGIRPRLPGPFRRANVRNFIENENGSADGFAGSSEKPYFWAVAISRPILKKFFIQTVIRYFGCITYGLLLIGTAIGVFQGTMHPLAALFTLGVMYLLFVECGSSNANS